MSSPESTSPRPHPVMMIAVMGIFLALLAWALSNSIPYGLTGQACLLILTLLAFRSWPPMIRWVSSMPIPHRVIFALMIASMSLGHYTLNGRTYYPYVSWFIFPSVREDDPVTCRQFIATTAGGQKVRLLVEQLFPSIIQVYPLEVLDDPHRYPPGATDRLASALVKVYNQHHADDPVRQVDLVLMAVKLHPPAGESRNQPSCELLKHYDFSSGR